jgi:tetratricopeptide (TPR) repeat protein
MSVVAEARLVTDRLAVRDLSTSALGLCTCAATAGLSADNGGFFASSWSWSTLALLLVALIALAVRSIERPRFVELGFAGAVVALSGWVWLSVVWSADRTQTVLEGERMLVLVAAVAVVLVLAGRRPVGVIVGGVLAGMVTVAAYALITRLFPDRIGGYDPLAGYRLGRPVGYWNGLGELAAFGLLLGLGFATRAARTRARIGGALSLVVLLPTLYFTFSRGSWIALAAGVAVLVTLDPRRLQSTVGLLVYVPAPALAVALASRSPALTRPHTALETASRDGHRLALVLVGVGAVQVLAALGFGAVQRRVVVPRSVRVAYATILMAILVAGLAATFGRYGGPVSIARHGYRSFTAPPPRATSDLNQRLFNLSGTWRSSLWKAAWHEAQAHPLLGDGAGAYEQYWLANRTTALDVQDAHNLYLETLAELGPVGVALLLALLGVPFIAAFRARRHPLVPAAAAALAVYAVHAAADWDWELAGVTLAAVLVGAASVVAGREQRDQRPERAPRKLMRSAAVFLLLLIAVAFVGLLGNAAAGKSAAAARAGRWSDAARYAHRVIRWAPWSSIGWQELGEAQLSQGRLDAARRSLRKAIAKDPRNWVLWLDLAAAGDPSARHAALERARELNPQAPELRGF